MPRRTSDRQLFFREFLRNFHTTGAVLPSGGRLAAALARYVAENGAPKRILEVGPGTGAVTRRIIAAMGPDDRADLVELNDRFVVYLRECIDNDPGFQSVAGRIRVHHCAAEELVAEEPYDLVISGLPLNNFTPPAVERILQALVGLLKPGGTLSFFQYIAIRRARALLSGRKERERLRGIGLAMDAVLRGNEIRRDWIWPNVPPAWVHHVRFQQSDRQALPVE
ncbi:MAG: methyltransferase domain-containing protein [Pirellulales bacterium]|nr:methyltransferase domain-containing protein [Pirellulales bacterium]